MRAAEIRERFAAILAERKPQRLCWVGCHEGEELPYVIAAGVPSITVVEPIPRLAAKLRARFPTVEVVQAACSDRTGTATLHIPAKSNMATLVGPTHGPGSTIEVPTRRLDDICPDADCAVIDVQGAEFEVLAAAPWDTLRLLMVETCTIDDPTLSPRYDLMVTYMRGRGFEEVASFPRDYDWIMRWAYGRATATGAEVRDVVFAKDAP